MSECSGRIFISHAKKDADIADALADLLKTGADVHTPEIFCTSLAGHGVPEGSDFVEYIRQQIESPKLVIALLSPAYYESVFCLCELGAAWAMQHSMFPLLIPPLTYGEMKGVLSQTQGGVINDPKKLDNLRDRVLSVLGKPQQDTALWNTKRDQFLVKLDTFPPRPALTKVPAGEMNKVNAKYTASLSALKEKEEELRELSATLEAVKKLRPVADVAKILASGDEKAEFTRLLDEAKDAVHNLLPVVREALFHRYAGTPFRPDDMDREAWANIQRAVEDKYLVDPDGGEVSVNKNDQAVRRAMEALDELGSFLDHAKRTFHAWFANDAGYDADITSGRFWRDHLEARV